MGKTGKLVGILIALACVFATESAIAQLQCVETMDMDSGAILSVACNTDSPAYEPSIVGANDIDLTVNSTSTVSEMQGGSQAILLNDGSTITNDGNVTATVSTQSAILIGNNAVIVNNGTITGGSGALGSAIIFTGTETSANNSVDNKSGGVITTAAGAAIVGSDGSEIIILRDGSTTTGDINLSGGSDSITIEIGATLNGNIDLGAGDDQLTLEIGATLTGEIDLGAGDDTLTLEDNADYTGTVFAAGDGNDTIVLEGSDGGGSTFHGNIDLGNSDVPTGANERNVLTLGQGSFLDGSVTGGLNDDFIDVGVDARIGGAILLGNGDNLVETSDGSMLMGGITGGSGIDLINLRDGSTTTGDINLSGGSDSITIESGATLNGNIDLGADADVVTLESGAILTGDILLGDGDDNLFLEDGAAYTGNVVAGAGSDRVVLRGTSGGGSTFTGTVILGDENMPDLGAGDEDLLKLLLGSFLDGDVTGSAADDRVEIATGAEIKGTIKLGDGANTLETFDGAKLTGDFTGGSGVDTVKLNADVEMTGFLDLLGGDDFIQLVPTSILTGSIMMGEGEDTLDYGFQASVTGSIKLGPGDDTFILRPTAVLPLPPDLDPDLDPGVGLDPGDGMDTLQLGASLLAGSFNSGTVDLGDAELFDMLVIGEEDAPEPVTWQVSTSSPVQFNSGVIVHPGTTLSFDGQVEIEITAEIMADSPANFSQSPDSVMQFDLGQSIDDSFLDLTGSLTIEPLVSGDPDDLVTTVIVNYEGNIIAGDYTLIRATEGITGEFDVEEFPASSIFDFSAEFNTDGGSGHIYLLTVEQIAFYNDFAESSNQTGVAQYLEDARAGAAVTSFADIITQLDAISDPSQRTIALAQLHPGSFDAHTSGILSWGRVQQRELQQRPMRCERFQFAPMPDVVTDDPCGAGGLMPWTKVVGSLGKNKGGSEPGYDSLVGGAIIGVDYKWNESLWLSGSMGYGTGEIEHDVGADGSFKSIDVGIAAGTVRGALSVRGSFTYSHGFHDVAREIDFLGARLESQFDSDRVGLALGAGYRLNLGLILIEPNVTIDYSHVVEEAVTEEGTAEVALNLKARTTDLFSGAAGVQFSTNILKYRYFGEMLEWADGLWIPSFSFKWRQAFGDVDRNATARMQGVSAAGGSFNSKASDSSGGVEIGAHLSFQPMKSGNTIELGYDGFFGGDVTTHSAKVTVRIPF